MDGTTKHKTGSARTPFIVIASAWLALMIGVVLSSATAQDHVIYETPDGRQSASGFVVDFTGSNGVLLRAGGQERTIPAAQVVRIETARIASHEQAKAAYANGEFESALALFRQARNEERRVWLRRELTADIIQCMRTLNDFESAAREFLILTTSDPLTPYFGCIPLHWTGGVCDTNMASLASGWIADDEAPEPILLIAGSALLTSTTNLRPEAIEALEDLSSSDDPRVAFLAQAQLWQVQVVRAAPALVRRWEEHIEHAPESLRAGPYYMLARALEHVDESEDAVLAWMRIPILYADQRDLGAAALYEAAETLEKLGRTDEAVHLYREILQDYGESPVRENVMTKEFVNWEIE